jgi:hypothetical protein
MAGRGAGADQTGTVGRRSTRNSFDGKGSRALHFAVIGVGTGREQG